MKKTLSFIALTLGVTYSSLSQAADYVNVVTHFKNKTMYQFQLPMSCSLLAGNNNSGLIIAGGYQNRTIKRIESYASGNTANISDPGIAVKLLTGENRHGPIVVGEDGYTVKYMDSYAANVWKSLPRPPFQIKGIAGNNRTGLIIHNDKELAYLSSYSGTWVRKRLLEENEWTAISGIYGNNTAGVWVVIGGTALYLKESISAPLQWIASPEPTYAGPTMFAGYPSDGIIMATFESFGGGLVQPWLYTHYGVMFDKFRGIAESASVFFPGSYGRLSLIGDPRTGIAYCNDSKIL